MARVAPWRVDDASCARFDSGDAFDEATVNDADAAPARFASRGAFGKSAVDDATRDRVVPQQPGDMRCAARPRPGGLRCAALAPMLPSPSGSMMLGIIFACCLI